MSDPLEGQTLILPSGERALVLSVEHEYDDGTTLRILDDPYRDRAERAEAALDEIATSPHGRDELQLIAQRALNHETEES